MKRRYLLERWNQFAAVAVPRDFPVPAKLALQKAFISGAGSLWDVVMGKLTTGSEPEAADEQLLGDIQAELEQYAMEWGVKTKQ